MVHALDAFLNEDLAGTLRENKGKLSFAYDKAWLNSEKFIPLSVTMPRQAEEFPDEITRPFFENLLPEGEIRAAIAKLKQLSQRNTFGLLGEIGGECAGAISLWPEGEKRRTAGGYSPISDERLEELLARMRKRPLLVVEDELRLSLAGAQNKLPVYYDGVQLFLPKGGAPSSHILKPGVAGYQHMPVNENFCMKVAAACGLPIPNSDVLFKPTPVYLVQRYDRVRTENGHLGRVHQIDFCQALNLPSHKKYEHEGGPDLAACFQILGQYSAQPAKDRLNLISWTIFNFLIGNSDAHAKNLSLLITHDGIALAPFYDLVSTVLYPDLTGKLTLRIGGENRPEWIQKRHWDDFAKISGANPRIVWRQLTELVERVPVEARRIATDAPFAGQKAALKIHKVVTDRSAKLKRMIGA